MQKRKKSKQLVRKNINKHTQAVAKRSKNAPESGSVTGPHVRPEG